MLACIAGVALFCHYLLGLNWGIAVLIGAILAPTDPVLASLVQVNDSRDSDPVRYGLSGEAGLNDGTAFPFRGVWPAAHRAGYARARLGG